MQNALQSKPNISKLLARRLNSKSIIYINGTLMSLPFLPFSPPLSLSPPSSLSPPFSPCALFSPFLPFSTFRPSSLLLFSSKLFYFSASQSIQNSVPGQRKEPPPSDPVLVDTKSPKKYAEHAQQNARLKETHFKLVVR